MLFQWNCFSCGYFCFLIKFPPPPQKKNHPEPPVGTRDIWLSLSEYRQVQMQRLDDKISELERPNKTVVCRQRPSHTEFFVMGCPVLQTVQSSVFSCWELEPNGVGGTSSIRSAFVWEKMSNTAKQMCVLFLFRQWTSFLSAASTAAYVYLYSFYYFFFKTK